MGAFQSVGGAATSGKTLTDSHIRAAIMAALAATEATDVERRTALFNKIAEDGKASEHLKATDYNIEQSTKCTVTEAYANAPDAEAAPSGDKIKVVEYAPDVFAALRRLTGTSNVDFRNEWTRAPPKANTVADKAAGLEPGEGRSGALFLKSKSMAFMCKTISETEVEVLMKILPKYLAHLERNPDSILMRFVMMLKVTLREDVGYILCFADCFTSCNVLHERWDLKGRKPKPGKFRHFLKHDLRQNTLKKVQAGSDDEPSSPNTTLSAVSSPHPHHKSGNGNSPAINIRTADSRKALRLLTLKDKNLSRLFWLEPTVRSELMAQLHSDVEFLNSCGLMDYSILIGVRYNTPEETVAKEIKRDTGRSSLALRMRQTHALGDENESGAVEVRNKGGPVCCDNEAQLNSTQALLCHINMHSSKFHQGVENLECFETYYIGIIDMLTTYNGKKATANFCKTLLWRENTLSTIPPTPYRKRIEKYAHQIFPLVVVEDEQAPVSPTGIKGKYDNLVRVASVRKRPNSTTTHPAAAEAPAPTPAPAPASSGKTVTIEEPVSSGPPKMRVKLEGMAKTADDQPPMLTARRIKVLDDKLRAVEKEKARKKEQEEDLAGTRGAGSDEEVEDREAFLNATVYPGPGEDEAAEPTALHNAATAGDIAAIRALISSQNDPNAQDSEGNTPLHCATNARKLAAVETLLRAKVQINMPNRSGHTPLHIAALEGAPKIAKTLIAAAADVDARDKSGCTPLHLAVENFNQNVVQVLIDGKADLSLTEDEGLTPLDCAVENGDDDMADLLRKAGARGRPSSM